MHVLHYFFKYFFKYFYSLMDLMEQWLRFGVSWVEITESNGTIHFLRMYHFTHGFLEWCKRNLNNIRHIFLCVVVIWLMLSRRYLRACILMEWR